MSITFVNASAWKKQSTHFSSLMYYQAQENLPLLSISSAMAPIIWRDQQGAFACVITDSSYEEFVLIRDHWGCEPFYYYYDDHYLIIGSNIPDILNCLPKPCSWNTTTILTLFTGMHVYSDETYHQHIKRVEPGTILHLVQNKPICKIPYWILDPEDDDLFYSNEDDYIDAFRALMHESVAFHTQKTSSLGGELSGGLDSSAILVTTNKQNTHYPLFMHVASPSGQHMDDRDLAERLLRHLAREDVFFINAESFDLISVLQFCSTQFAGAAPYIFFMLANNIHQAVVNRGCKVLLSGAGGDQCVSNHASQHYMLPQLIKKNTYRDAWFELMMEYQVRETSLPSVLRRAEILLKYSNPIAFRILTQLEAVGKSLRDFFQSTHTMRANHKPQFYPSIRHYEREVLQGPNSHDIRMRVEYSAVLAKSMGFEYRYPLLYPKLVDFCFRLPLSFKKRDGVGRYMIRKYLETEAPREVFMKMQKAGGIIPATLEQSIQRFSEGQFDRFFKGLPSVAGAKMSSLHQKLATNIHAYMFHFYADNRCCDSDFLGASAIPSKQSQ